VRSPHNVTVTESLTAVEDAAVESLVARRIEERTHRGIRNLHVEWVDDGIVLSGHADRYYFVQLALAGALEVLRQGAVRLEIAVDAS
jgi:hypothetical protein